MKLLPYQPSSELVTRADIHALTASLRGEMGELRVDMQRLVGAGIAANMIAVIT
jgi:hypothetical protein